MNIMDGYIETEVYKLIQEIKERHSVLSRELDRLYEIESHAFKILDTYGNFVKQKRNAELAAELAEYREQEAERKRKRDERKARKRSA